MKKLLMLFLFFAVGAAASPYYDTNPVPAGVTKCLFTVDDVAKPAVPVTVVNAATICRWDLNGTLAGAHKIDAKGETPTPDPIWGAQVTDPMLVPFSFTKPAPLPALTSKGLSP